MKIKVEYWHTDFAWLAQVWWSEAEGIKYRTYRFLAPTYTAKVYYEDEK